MSEATFGSRRRPDRSRTSQPATERRTSSRLAVRFYDVGAVVYFLRKVVWTVPNFTVTNFRDRLRVLHEHIAAKGSFVSHAHRGLIEARKPR